MYIHTMIPCIYKIENTDLRRFTTHPPFMKKITQVGTTQPKRKTKHSITVRYKKPQPLNMI